MKIDFWEEKILCIIYPDEYSSDLPKYPTYIYSDELFDWFYSKLKYTSDTPNEFAPLNLNYERTKEDNSANGCRIYDKEGNYEKLYETYFLMELTRAEWSEISILSKNEDIKLSDVINYFYRINPRKI